MKSYGRNSMASKLVNRDIIQQQNHGGLFVRQRELLPAATTTTNL